MIHAFSVLHIIGTIRFLSTFFPNAFKLSGSWVLCISMFFGYIVIQFVLKLDG